MSEPTLVQALEDEHVEHVACCARSTLFATRKGALYQAGAAVTGAAATATASTSAAKRSKRQRATTGEDSDDEEEEEDDDGAALSYTTPVALPFQHKITQLAAGRSHVLALAKH